MNASLTIDQLLRAAQLLERSNPLLNSLNDIGMYKLGQDYQDHYLQPKIMNLDSGNFNGFNSSGSSHRSSPSSLSNQSNSSHSTAPSSPLVHQSSRGNSHSTRQSRAAHNELEKNRRANLRNYLEHLKSVLPPDCESSRDTTLSLLTRARNFIRVVKERQTQLNEAKKALESENEALEKELAALEEVEPLIADEPKQEEAIAQPTIFISSPMELKQEPLTSNVFDFGPKTDLIAQLNVLQQLNQLNNKLLQQQQHVIYNPNLRPTPIDLLNEGLLPQLPLLYPYPHLQGSLS
ncbi:unnamed protein product [Bursaphelenchus xylophilus]|uniref:(pine wood nematode) hypothetical protein n=1 Tax=Bursaphelenchus xylophilus TaxID=6326 RepID=A0A1I7SQ52_BURXY|nr:unnamed protein product [Bursaphelenchus xylophilus]CAG9109615.1 unnamed protein product [Bursaphelenchus xylophilus]